MRTLTVKNAALWFGRHVASALTIFVLLLAFVFGFAYALSFPGSAPSGETAGGKFASYFRNMFATANRCPDGQAIRYFDTDGTPRCAAVGTQLTSTSIQSKSSGWMDISGVGSPSNTLAYGCDKAGLNGGVMTSCDVLLMPSGESTCGHGITDNKCTSHGCIAMPGQYWAMTLNCIK